MRSRFSHSHVLTNSLNPLKERDRARNGPIMTDKSQTTNVGYGQLSEKARRTLHEASRPLSINLAATKLHAEAPRKSCPTLPRAGRRRGVKDEQTDLVSFDICGPTRGGDTFQVSIPAEQREELKRVRKTLRSYDAALPGQVDDDLEFHRKAVRRRERLSPHRDVEAWVHRHRQGIRSRRADVRGCGQQISLDRRR